MPVLIVNGHGTLITDHDHNDRNDSAAGTEQRIITLTQATTNCVAPVPAQNLHDPFELKTGATPSCGQSHLRSPT